MMGSMLSMIRTVLASLLLVCVVCLVAPAGHGQVAGVGAAAAGRAPQGPEEVVRGFYAWYLGRFNKDDWSPLKRRAEALRYLSPELHRKAPRMMQTGGADIFICAQDWLPSWAGEFKVAPARVRGAAATTTVTLPVRGVEGAGAGEDIRIKLSLRRAARAWKITATDCLLSFEGSR